MTAVIVGVAAMAAAGGCGDTSHTASGAPGSTTESSESVASSVTTAEPTTTTVGLPPADAYARPSDPLMSIDQASAEKVFAALYPLRSRAVYEHDETTITAIETGAAREYDVARCRAGCPESRPQPASVPHTFSAPPQSSYPAFFVARATRNDAKGRPVSELVVFTRDSVDVPWLIALDNPFDGVNPVLTDGSQDLGRAPPPTQPEATSLEPALAAYWQHWWDHGAAPADTPFIDNGLSTRGARIAAGHDQDDQLGQDETKTYTADPKIFVVAARNGDALTCGVIRFASHYTPAPGHGPLVQSPSRTNWGYSVPPGNYSAVDSSGLEQDCTLTGTSGPARVIYTEPLDTSTTATP